ncbi:hypothetical protein PCASD_13498 [Puccinia coronata f. sp. avenae]|uniref:Uncharacterized protein n=1 Tax=Puccinia coronata f. sp. avenae TaxID=200324 RepID=A0A2N5TEF5_9BASI|nr:hypothetical protein PCASD_13498 [Puccinia coronata f. sp. avenae]
MADMTARGLKDSAIIQQQQERITFLEEQFEQNKKAEAEKEKERGLPAISVASVAGDLLQAAEKILL